MTTPEDDSAVYEEKVNIHSAVELIEEMEGLDPEDRDVDRINAMIQGLQDLQNEGITAPEIAIALTKLIHLRNESEEVEVVS